MLWSHSRNWFSRHNFAHNTTASIVKPQYITSLLTMPSSKSSYAANRVIRPPATNTVYGDDPDDDSGGNSNSGSKRLSDHPPTSGKKSKKSKKSNHTLITPAKGKKDERCNIEHEELDETPVTPENDGKENSNPKAVWEHHKKNKEEATQDVTRENVRDTVANYFFTKVKFIPNPARELEYSEEKGTYCNFFLKKLRLPVKGKEARNWWHSIQKAVESDVKDIRAQKTNGMKRDYLGKWTFDFLY